MPAGKGFLVEDGMLGEKLYKSEKKIKKNINLYGFEMKNHLLHAVHPLAWFRKIEIQIDDKKIPSDQFYFELRNQLFRGDQIHQITDVFWHLCEPAHIYFEYDKELEEGKHKISCELFLSRYEGTEIVDFDGKWPLHSQKAEKEMRLEGEI